MWFSGSFITSANWNNNNQLTIETNKSWKTLCIFISVSLHHDHLFMFCALLPDHRQGLSATRVDDLPRKHAALISVLETINNQTSVCPPLMEVFLLCWCLSSGSWQWTRAPVAAEELQVLLSPQQPPKKPRAIPGPRPRTEPWPGQGEREGTRQRQGERASQWLATG